MAYTFITTPERSKIMSKIKSKDTKPEILLAKRLWEEGVRYRKNYSKLPGKSDIAITKYKIAIFIDGEFWHGYNWNEKKKKIVQNRDYWIPKIEKNIQRDIKNNELLQELGWKVIRIWEKDLKKDINRCVGEILNIIAGLQDKNESMLK